MGGLLQMERTAMAAVRKSQDTERMDAIETALEMHIDQCRERAEAYIREMDKLGREISSLRGFILATLASALIGVGMSVVSLMAMVRGVLE